MKKKRRRSRRALPEASYVCQNCGEEIVIPLDVTAGTEQEYVRRLSGLLPSAIDPCRFL